MRFAPAPGPLSIFTIFLDYLSSLLSAIFAVGGIACDRNHEGTADKADSTFCKA